jgi:pyruvate kinase
MLSGETAVGSFPVDTVATMADIARAAEGELDRWGVSELMELRYERDEIGRDDLLALSVYLMVETLEPELIVVHTRSGTTARRLSRFGLSQWIVAPSRVESTCQRLQFSRGIFPQLVEGQTIASPEKRRLYAQKMLERYGVHNGRVLLLEEAGTLRDADTQRLDVIDLSDQEAS